MEDSDDIIDKIYLYDYIINDLDKKAAHVEFGELEDHDRRLFALAIYLILANENSDYAYVYDDVGKLQPAPEYKTKQQTGKAIGYFEEDNRLFTREFENASVIVNLRNEKYTPDLSSYSSCYELSINGGGSLSNQGSLTWNEIDKQTFILKPKTAVILKCE